MSHATIDYSDIPGQVYTLLLQNNCYYVGWSSQVEKRIAQHFSGAGSTWTKLHKPVQVLQRIPGNTTLENVTTIALMCQHGWENVRGGAWTCPELKRPPAPILYANVSRSIQRSETPRIDSDDTRASIKLARDSQSKQCLDTPTSYMLTAITIAQRKQDGESCSWRAEITNEKACNECPKRGFKCIYGCSFRELVDAIEQWKATSGEVEEENLGALQETSHPAMRPEHSTKEPNISSGITTPCMSSNYAWQTDDSIQVKRCKIYGDYARKVSGKNCAWGAHVWCEKASRTIARGFKCIHAETEHELNKLIADWLSRDVV